MQRYLNRLTYEKYFRNYGKREWTCIARKREINHRNPFQITKKFIDKDSLKDSFWYHKDSILLFSSL
jgi:hypothetical protein